MAIQHDMGVLSNNSDYFHYSSVWDTWSRVLVRGGEQQGFKKEISIELTPFGGYEGLVARGMRLERILKLYTPVKEQGDIYSHVLPKSVYNAMCKHLTPSDLNWFIDYDILKSVDIKALANIAVGEIKYSEVKMDGPGDIHWLKRLKTFKELFDLPTQVEEQVKTSKLKKLTERFPTPRTRRFTFSK